MRDLPNLDFVRSVAVISVVAEHTLLALGIDRVGPFPVAYFGVTGVLVFFVLTALVLMWSLERKPHTLDFYIRRFFRIYPLAVVVLVAAVLLHAPVSGGGPGFFAYPPRTAKALLVAATLLRPSVAQFLGVMWSLPYEVKMYLLLPAVFFFVRRNFALWPLVLMWGLVILETHITNRGEHNFGVAIGYFLPGVMSYICFSRWKPRLPGWLLPVFLAAAWLGFLYRPDFQRGWVFCLVIGLGLPLFRQIQTNVVLTPSRLIAKYSYGIYLTHPFAIALGLYVLRGQGLGVRLLAEFVPLVVLPVLAYHLIEHPMIRLGSRLAAKAEARYEQRELKQFRLPPAA